MELNIADPSSDDLWKAFGISEARTLQLNKLMDKITASYQGQTVRVCDVFADIAFICDNPEELSVCLAVHIAYVAKRYGYNFLESYK